jgi:semaphorin 5
VDGGYGEWSSWTSCTAKSGEKCKCRMRLCNSPEPRNGGKSCDESSLIEIQNCDVNGGWTTWSEWSACKFQGIPNCDNMAASATPAIRSRTRTCTNPEPKFNGRICVGHDREEEVCTPEMINPCGTTNSQWLSWGAWEECSKQCGEGFQMRRRVCGGKNCLGCNQEWRTCNSEPCKGYTQTDFLSI